MPYEPIVMRIREAQTCDAAAMSDVLVELAAAGKREAAGDAAFVRNRYLVAPSRVRCSLAIDDGNRILGFQSLKIAAAGNPYDTPVGWGIIGTHVRPSAARSGIGKALFAETLRAARGASLKKIEAFIAAGNSEGLAYYDAIGFLDWRTTENAICKAFTIVSSAI